MGALDDIDLLTGCTSFILPKITQGEEETLALLETSGSTTYVNALRSFRVQRCVIAVGMFSLFEAALQVEYNWVSPFVEIDRHLREHGHSNLASRFDSYRLAVNVLKHGEGRSLEQLLSRQSPLPFRVKKNGEYFEDEGDSVEGQLLVDVDDLFILDCAEVITTVRSTAAELFRAQGEWS
ncbi:MAG: hypothetical protein Q8O63_13210 [Hoeflea sp.]|nr:hypothetical protein [Hoeflea sp.]